MSSQSAPPQIGSADPSPSESHSTTTALADASDVSGSLSRAIAVKMVPSGTVAGETTTVQSPAVTATAIPSQATGSPYPVGSSSAT